MKKVFLLLALASVTLTGCLDNLEEFTIASNGSGTYKSNLDMSGMMEMLEMMAAMDNSSENSEFKKAFENDIDSVVQMQSIVDTASDLSAEQKKLFRDATMSMNISQKKKVFKMGMTYPFSSLDDVKKIISYNEKGEGVGIYGKKQGENSNPLSSMGGSTGIPGGSSFYDMILKDGLIERKIDESKLGELKNNKDMPDLAQAEEMLEAMTFTTIFYLPRPVKKLTGDKATLSADKKTVTIKSNMTDLMKNAQALAFRIEY